MYTDLHLWKVLKSSQRFYTANTAADELLSRWLAMGGRLASKEGA
jgi:hypothetical protein